MTYPQLDIRTYDPHLSSKLANMVMGDFELTGMSHEIRVMRLAAIIGLLEYVVSLGGFEHTGDWDWRIEVYGNEFAPTPDGDKGEWADTMTMAYEIEPSDYTDGFARWENLTLEVWGEDDNPHDVSLPIDDIRMLRIYYES